MGLGSTREALHKFYGFTFNSPHNNSNHEAIPAPAHDHTHSLSADITLPSLSAVPVRPAVTLQFQPGRV